MATVTSRGNTIVGTGANGAWASTANAIDGTVGTDPATYATWTITTPASGASTITIGGYSFGTLTGTINSCTARIRHMSSNALRIVAISIQLQDSTGTNIGSAAAVTPAAANGTVVNQTVTLGTPTLSQVNAGLRTVTTVTRSSGTVSVVWSVDQVDVTIDNTPAATATAAPPFRKIDYGALLQL